MSIGCSTRCVVGSCRGLKPFRKLLEQRAFGQTVDLGALGRCSRPTITDWAPLHALYLSALALSIPSGAGAVSRCAAESAFSPSEERLPEPTDELRPLATLLARISRGFAARYHLSRGESIWGRCSGCGNSRRSCLPKWVASWSAISVPCVHCWAQRRRCGCLVTNRDRSRAAVAAQLASAGAASGSTVFDDRTSPPPARSGAA